MIHEYLIRFGGAERVLLELAKMFPDAPIYVFLYDKEKMGEWFPTERVRPSFLRCWPRFLRRRHKWLLPLMPIIPESFDLREFDLIISSSSSFAKGVVARPQALHISYCHNPARFLWDGAAEYLEQQNLGFCRRVLAEHIFSYLRLWDRAAGQRVDYFIANSRATAGRIKKYYNREAEIIYPPVNIAAGADWAANRRADIDGGYFLIVSQLAPYKKIEIAVDAFNKLGLPLIIIGEGPRKKYLRKLAGKNIQILGWLSDEEVAGYFRDCRAFIFSGEDDFGITIPEAMSWGKPVLALNAGGARETVLPGLTGEFFEAATPEVLADGVRRLQDGCGSHRYNPLVIRKWAEKFSAEIFRRKFMKFVEKVV